jgi:hypothetical protein
MICTCKNPVMITAAMLCRTTPSPRRSFLFSYTIYVATANYTYRQLPPSAGHQQPLVIHYFASPLPSVHRE